MNSAELLQQQLAASTRKRKPKGVRLDASAGITYNAELQRIVRNVSKDVNSVIMTTVRNLAPEYQRDAAMTLDSWVDVLTAALRTVRERYETPQFKALVVDIARRFVNTANTSNLRRTERDLGINLYGDSQQLSEYVQASIADNVRLITSIPDQYLTQVESIVMTNVRAGGRPASIAKSLQQQLGVTERRAKMIARDQTAKVNGDLNRLRQTDAGFPYFQWMDSDDERVRDRHEYLAEHVTQYGKGVYRWDNPPLSDKGVPIIPGQDYQCRCIGRPVSQEEVDANVKAGRVVKGVKR